MKGLALALFLLPVGAMAEECGQTQSEMTNCAERAYQAADDDLNAAYKQASLVAHMIGQGAQDALLTAQRAWITYRDAACKAEGALYEGGSIQPMIVASCLERLTKARSADLRATYVSN